MVSTKIILNNIIAAQHVIPFYIKRSKKVIVEEKNTTDTLPQTFIPGDEKDVPINEILHEKSKWAYYFLNSHKIKNKLWGSMIDITASGPVPMSTQKPCWWCRHPFTNRPIGCPTSYSHHRTSGIDKDRIEEKFKEANIPFSTNDFFIIEGLFCSFPCCKAYILDKNGSIKYKESVTLLSLLFYSLYKKRTEIVAAPTWKILKDYGGHLTIEEYRSSFGKLDYQETINTRRPYMFCSSQYISEKKIKLFRGS